MRIVRPKEAQHRLGIGNTKYYEDLNAGILPQHVQLGPRCVGMIEEELNAYIEGLKQKRDAGRAA
jgi:predicted DNA-binding transcriptional regulator AlpA